MIFLHFSWGLLGLNFIAGLLTPTYSLLISGLT